MDLRQHHVRIVAGESAFALDRRQLAGIAEDQDRLTEAHQVPRHLGIFTHDAIPVFFRREEFDHAFFESSTRQGENDVFSLIRAERMDWIAAALADPGAQRFQGWLKRERRHDPTRRVTVVMGDFVVIIALSKRRDGRLKAKFITCYRADNSIGKILSAPLWTREDCDDALL